MIFAPLVELVDTHGLGPCALRHESSSLLGGTKRGRLAEWPKAAVC